jgi:outer membrane protein OmpA-like peptidoglycan-associated protein
MRLSQDRTRDVLIYCLDKVELSPKQYNWSRKNIVAAGFSSSKTINSSGGKEDKEASRRVEFRVRTNADEKLSLILEEKKT